MKDPLAIIQYLNILTTCVTISIGIKFFSRHKENKILLNIPILSLFQIVLSEIVKIVFRFRYNITYESIVLTNIYIILEYFIIILFFWKLKQTRKEKIFITISFFIAFISLFISPKLRVNQNLISIDTLLFVEGPIIQTLTLSYLFNSMRKKNITNCIQDPNYLAALGIFFSFLILWPSNILFNFFLKNPSYFFNFFFISNSLSYLIFFSFLTISFYVTRKSGIN